jgi:hypothetical protein
MFKSGKQLGASKDRSQQGLWLTGAAMISLASGWDEVPANLSDQFHPCVGLGRPNIKIFTHIGNPSEPSLEL